MKRIVSGITPSGDGTLHIGNYLGAVRQFIEIANSPAGENDCFLFIADLHALTTVQNKVQLEINIENLILNELALLAGLGKLDHITFYRQSDIFFHTELQTILNNITPLGLLKRAHAYKDKLSKDVMEAEINLGLFNYPVLMAADILLYKADLVPVGKDQKQHVEITRDIAERFNKIFKKNILKLPEAYIPESVATILGTDGERKMSKSLGNIISIFEPEEVIRKQVMSCYTDPTRKHASDPGHIEGNMVFSYLDFFGDKKTKDEYKEKYKKGKVGDIEIKEYLYSSLMKAFQPAREKYQELVNNPQMVKEILGKGTAHARSIAAKTMAEVRSAVGLVNQYSFSSSESRANQDLIQNQSFALKMEQFAVVEIRVGKVVKAENVEKSQKLIRLSVDLGEFGKRIIFTGVRGFGYKPEDFLDKQFLFVTNLEYRKMMGEESQGMILAVDGLELPFGEHGGKKPVFVSADNLPVGAKVR